MYRVSAGNDQIDVTAPYLSLLLMTTLDASIAMELERNRIVLARITNQFSLQPFTVITNKYER